MRTDDIVLLYNTDVVYIKGKKCFNMLKLVSLLPFLMRDGFICYFYSTFHYITHYQNIHFYLHIMTMSHKSKAYIPFHVSTGYHGKWHSRICGESYSRETDQYW